MDHKLIICHWNANGILGKLAELISYNQFSDFHEIFQKPPTLKDSKARAAARLIQLESRLAKNKPLCQEYHRFMYENIQLRHMHFMKDADIKKTGYYIPHHAVVTSDSTTTKLRDVFDASCNTSDKRQWLDVHWPSTPKWHVCFTITLEDAQGGLHSRHCENVSTDKSCINGFFGDFLHRHPWRVPNTSGPATITNYCHNYRKKLWRYVTRRRRNHWESTGVQKRTYSHSNIKNVRI